MANIFQQVLMRKVRRNKFDLSHERKLSCFMGNLIPIMNMEVMPGDKFRVSTEILMRLAPMLAPVMHRVNVWVHYFYVPTRILWDEFEAFITGGKDGLSAPVWPHLVVDSTNAVNFGNGTLADHLGLPDFSGILAPATVELSALPFRAYQMIYNEYFRDQTLSAEIPINKTSGLDAGGGNLWQMRTRCWEKDYLTSALPFAQRGGDVELPLQNLTVNYKPVTTAVKSAGGATAAGNVTAAPAGAVSELQVGSDDIQIQNIDTIGPGGVTIEDLRRASRLQEFLEKMAVGGARYAELLRNIFDVKSSDSRLQRPEFLGGGRQPVVMSEVLSTFTVDGVSAPQGNMSGHGISVGGNAGFSRRFEEHGYVIGIMSVLPRTGYQQGIHRMWTRPERFDYPWPDFAHLGEQAVKNKEVYWDQGDPDGTFGYQSRYSEFKYGSSTVHGEFRDSLAFWHMGRIFAGIPALNEAFVRADPTDRIFAVSDPNVEKLYVQLFNKVDAVRPLPYFGTPRL